MSINFEKIKRDTLELIRFKLEANKLLPDYDSNKLDKIEIPVQYNEIGNRLLTDSLFSIALFTIKNDGFLKNIQILESYPWGRKIDYYFNDKKDEGSPYFINPINNFYKLYKELISN